MSAPDPADGPRLPPAYRLVALDSVDSTNAEAWRLAERGAEEGTLVWARRQESGRGRRGRGWVSESGNLFLSLVLRPDCAPDEAAQLGFVAALAVGEAIGSVAPPMIQITYKWPNDVLFNGRKGAGILLESKMSETGLDWLILGVGVNVASHPRELDPPVTSLRFEGAGGQVSEARLLEAFARHFLLWTDRWVEDGFAPVRRAWLTHAERLGEEIRVELPRESLTGRFQDLDETGALLLKRPDGSVRKVTAGEIHFAA